METRHANLELTQFLSAEAKAESTGMVTASGRGNREVRLRNHAVGDRPPPDRGENLLHILLVETHDGGAVERHLIYEFRECRSNLRDRGVVIEMLAVDVRDHGENGRELQERAVTLVRLHHQQ